MEQYAVLIPNTPPILSFLLLVYLFPLATYMFFFSFFLLVLLFLPLFLLLLILLLLLLLLMDVLVYIDV